MIVSTMPNATARIAYTELKSNTTCQTSCERFLHPLFSERCMWLRNRTPVSAITALETAGVISRVAI